MPENGQSGSEGGGAGNRSPYPYSIETKHLNPIELQRSDMNAPAALKLCARSGLRRLLRNGYRLP